MSNDFELAPVKMNARMDLREQCLQMAPHLARKNNVGDKLLHMLTLPGEYWAFETMMIHSLKGTDIKPFFVGVETKGNTFYKANKLKPAEIVGYWHRSLEDSLTDRSYHYGIVWADYCGYATTLSIQKLVEHMSRSNKVAIYATFYINGRCHGIKLDHNTSEDHVTAIEEEFEYWFRFYKFKKKVKLIYKNVYANGRGNRMLTIGFTWVGVPVKKKIYDVEPVKTVKKSSHKDQAIEEFDKIAYAKGYRKEVVTFYKKGKKSKNFKVYEPEISKRERTLINKQVAQKLNISTQKVGAIMAHYHNPYSFCK